jgi:peptidoglycan hydrolase-like protein with peptidoglycan-binding domain
MLNKSSGLSSMRLSVILVFVLACMATITSADTYSVRHVQTWLAQLGYNPGPIDGSYGRGTASALTQFYVSLGTEFDGTLDQNEIDDLRHQLRENGDQFVDSFWQPSTVNSRNFSNLEIHSTHSIPAEVRPTGRVPNWGQVPSSSSDSREQFIIDENFQVRRGQRVLLENKIIRMVASGNQVKNIKIFGDLEIRNSLIIWEQKFNEQVALSVERGGNLEIYNSYGFARDGLWWFWDFQNGSKVILDRAFLDVWTTAHGSVSYSARNFSQTRLTLREDLKKSNIFIENSINTDLEIFTPRGSSTALSVPPSKAEVNWTLGNFYQNSSIELINSKVGRIDVTLTDDSDITLVNYADGQLGLNIDGGQGRRKTCSIDGFGDPTSMRGIWVDRRTWDIDCNNSSVTFINSNVVAFWATVWGNMELEVTNSRLIDPSNVGCKANLIIRNSTMNLLRTLSQDWCGSHDAKTFVSDSEIKQGVDASGSRAYVWLHNTVVRSQERSEALSAREGATIAQHVARSIPW